jgi:hypothetical protein
MFFFFIFESVARGLTGLPYGVGRARMHMLRQMTLRVFEGRLLRSHCCPLHRYALEKLFENSLFSIAYTTADRYFCPYSNGSLFATGCAFYPTEREFQGWTFDNPISYSFLNGYYL